MKQRVTRQSAYRAGLKHLSKPENFGRSRMTDIPATDVARFVSRQQAAGLKGWTIKGQLTVLSSVFSYSSRHMGLNAQNPVALLDSVERPSTEDEKPKRILNADELARLIAAVPEDYRLLFELAAETGGRLGEVLGLTWADIDLTERTVTFTHQLDRKGVRQPLKTKRSRRCLEVTDQVAARLREHKSSGGTLADHALVFRSPRTDKPPTTATSRAASCRRRSTPPASLRFATRAQRRHVRPDLPLIPPLARVAAHRRGLGHRGGVVAPRARQRRHHTARLRAPVRRGAPLGRSPQPPERALRRARTRFRPEACGLAAHPDGPLGASTGIRSIEGGGQRAHDPSGSSPRSLMRSITSTKTMLKSKYRWCARSWPFWRRSMRSSSIPSPSSDTGNPPAASRIAAALLARSSERSIASLCCACHSSRVRRASLGSIAARL